MRTHVSCCSEYYWTHPWKFVRDLYKDVCAFFQRGFRGWADCDVWSLDDYLSEVLIGSLKHLQEIQHGVPNWHETEEKYSKEKYPDMNYQERLELGAKDWWKIMDKMILAFEKKRQWGNNTMKTDYYGSEEQTRDEATVEEGMQLFVKWFDALWD